MINNRNKINNDESMINNDMINSTNSSSGKVCGPPNSVSSIQGLPGHSLDPSPTPAAAGVELSQYTAATLAELLGLCEEFLRTAGPAVHAELRRYLTGQTPPADPGWLIDMLGFHQLHLHQRIKATTPSPRDNWHTDPDHDRIIPVTAAQARTGVVAR
ncbi:hypothetical protein FOE78_20655 [Microlunatus elymi]|uniref:Uncharacterized protein n=1 Tax=Microlunatus elymi TaxID=2596828 RepID=A0A516PVU3_9ACTN|nr:hypothetical protein [Microlunatus elymi]QDP94791.1 hypothetical protein FOE78_01645 [Microlunatus elymi]QDP94999.1 hypothetical protein FOE78_02880 [Microlunatus elymi]QDP95305.1 hypothetical protein FOE78_04720 [Microlunatus elymi]QDP97739.1 hypothetical protein FOE78_19125 [Microlunatus elymi]QDP97989.1 hypothetical protein FOE78_20655 [Microlunatus elymi]